MKTHIQSLFTRAFVAAAAVGMATLGAQASSVVKMNFRDLAARSDLVFAGTVTQTREVALPDGSMAYTFVTFTDLDILAGTYDDSFITLQFEGGTLSIDERIDIPGMPEFEAGERFVLFTVCENGRIPCAVTGWTQGQIRLDADDQLADSGGHPIHTIRGGRFLKSMEHGDDAQPRIAGGLLHETVHCDDHVHTFDAGQPDEAGTVTMHGVDDEITEEIRAQRLTLDILRHKLQVVRARIMAPRTDAERARVEALPFTPDPSRVVRSASPADLPATFVQTPVAAPALQEENPR